MKGMGTPKAGGGARAKALKKQIASRGGGKKRGAWRIPMKAGAGRMRSAAETLYGHGGHR